MFGAHEHQNFHFDLIKFVLDKLENLDGHNLKGTKAVGG